MMPDLAVVHPALLLLVTAVLVAAVPWPTIRRLPLLMAPLTLVQLWLVQPGRGLVWLGLELHWLQPGALGRLFASAFVLALWGTSLYGLTSLRRHELAAAWGYAAGALIVCFSGDWLCLLCGWELMAVASTLIVFSGRQPDSAKAGMRYLLIHLAGGVLLLSGIATLAASGQSLLFGPLTPATTAYWLILAGVLVNTGAPPLGFWVADTYPQASAAGMVILSALTTKTAVFVLLSAFAGEPLLIAIGLYLCLYGTLYALLADDLRRLLAYSIIHQVGFMVVAAGIGSPAAINGAAAQAFAHIAYKMTLVMAAGVLLQQLGQCRASTLPALARQLPLTSGCVLVATAASLGLPLTAGFVSKTLLVGSAAASSWPWLETALLLSSAAVVFNAGIRFPALALFGAGATRPQATASLTRLNSSVRLALLGSALLCLLPGWWPQLFCRLLPFATSCQPYSPAAVLHQLQLLLVAGLVCLLSWPFLRPTAGHSRDWDVLLRLLLQLWQRLLDGQRQLSRFLWQLLTSSQIRSFMFLFRTHGPHGILARSWPTGSLALWVALLLASYIVLYNLKTRSLWQFFCTSFGLGC
ncbi:proton-conducting transporter membrane subunit [Desulfuromonas thiophila]|uniref:Multicomponent Na+:H+ antiporter subunit D n=1 Tax=Desulfuromonas thiophila TaxID=57664 RepID=A0A1G6ZSV6_9BACT|nr:proton-conducting transporter membrane subunit [Desulfuromonas thiophila]SDE05612.1 multicomponent Na+:H+ antiporter subunit D [Desulfuromonas thiophila]